MKKIYESPVFIAEEYCFSESIAKCAHEVDPNEALTINLGDNLCSKSHNGHKYGGQQGDDGNIITNGGANSVTLFNDLATPDEKNDCEYDWDYNNNIVYSPSGADMGTFAAAFYGNESNKEQHAPGYKGAAFFS